MKITITIDVERKKAAQVQAQPPAAPLPKAADVVLEQHKNVASLPQYRRYL